MESRVYIYCKTYYTRHYTHCTKSLCVNLRALEQRDDGLYMIHNSLYCIQYIIVYNSLVSGGCRRRRLTSETPSSGASTSREIKASKQLTHSRTYYIYSNTNTPQYNTQQHTLHHPTLCVIEPRCDPWIRVTHIYLSAKIVFLSMGCLLLLLWLFWLLAGAAGSSSSNIRFWHVLGAWAPGRLCHCFGVLVGVRVVSKGLCRFSLCFVGATTNN